MSPLEIAANAVYLVSVWLANRNSVHTWWTGIVGCGLFGIVFSTAHLYADLTLQVFFVVTSCLGWWQWRRTIGGVELQVRATPRRLLWLCTVIGTVVGIGYGALLKAQTPAVAPYWDSLAACASVLAQLLLMGRRYETWWFWLIANTIYVPLYASRDLPLTALVYAAFWINAVFSLRSWRRLVFA